MGLIEKIEQVVLSVPEELDTNGWAVYVNYDELYSNGKHPGEVMGYKVIASSICRKGKVYFMKEVDLYLSEL